MSVRSRLVAIVTAAALAVPLVGCTPTPQDPFQGAQQEFEGVNPNSRYGFPNFPKVEPVVKPETGSCRTPTSRA